ncbi:Protein kinase family protein [Quillaja saponaria]|uniref:non-specific serine/threonine protein kinase n=1 Tax=Quillaja saponaria TaxID=32244 RepID=A0AAD7PX36_QUISA|nr:Protein kinase family protein [Quillaja saponaria]
MENTHIFLSSIIIISSFLLTNLPPSHGRDDELYTVCNRPFQCGNITNMLYPFYGNDRPRDCGSSGFELDCKDNQYPVIEINSLQYRVLKINNQSYTMTLAREDLLENTCPTSFLQTRMNTSYFEYATTVRNLTIYYGCPPGIIHPGNNFTCGDGTAYFKDEAQNFPPINFSGCNNSIEVPVIVNPFNGPQGGIDALERALNRGFDVQYTADWTNCSVCRGSGGLCGMDSAYQFSCHCHNGTSPSSCQVQVHKKSWSLKAKVIVGVCTAFVSVVIMSIIFFIYFHHYKKRNAPSLMYSQNMSSTISSKEPENGSIYFKVHLFTYNELEEATDNFDSARELGDGGFGTVYYGKLQDGRTVAVKRLYENNYRRVEQFMNEVEILTRLRHKNLVSLYGCTSRHGRELLLVYEYIPNGTVADHLHGERAKPGSLPWSIRMNIAIETACALAYLHASDTIHRDVKTNNILLDNNFSVKVADFGLSRLFPNHVTHISTAPQGTPGYVDPEYHECYQLTDKSDVFSFGVVLIELISSMPAVDITRHRHEINLSNMAINKIQNRALHELVDTSLGYESDYKVRKMINAVAELAFRCLQSLKDMRPSMVEVLEVLEDIQNDGSTKGKPDVMDISKDDAALLKSGPPPASPDSVTSNIKSTTTTPNASG